MEHIRSAFNYKVVYNSIPPKFWRLVVYVRYQKTFRDILLMILNFNSTFNASAIWMETTESVPCGIPELFLFQIKWAIKVLKMSIDSV